ncbi:hypothetical protein TSAR_006097 [Trichomalopsis sarcophagae]|uniref:Uncharacterized protein n=1 Tax=Trichomalopsis sarcophagae TaxID=543379 RepID=A0A232ELN8_9HYME|nr:hypothetical protein TSAR_006097 [Trichomalopsis sarcophagae]
MEIKARSLPVNRQSHRSIEQGRKATREEKHRNNIKTRTVKKLNNSR